MNLGKLTLACLLALLLVAPVIAADIIVNDSCTIFDAIIAANTDSPAGACSAGSGADTILVGPSYLIPNTDIWSFGSRLRHPFPPITSAITIKSGIRPDEKGTYPGENYTFNFIAVLNSAIEVAGGGYLILDEIDIWNNEVDHSRAMAIRRGGRVGIYRSGLFLVPEPCGAIYNQGSLTISGTRIVMKSGTAKQSWIPEPGAVMIFNDGGSVSDSGNYFHNLEGTNLYMGSTGDCGAPGSATVSRPAPECKLEPQLQAGDRALRRGSSYSNLRAEAGISGERVGRIEAGAVVDVIEGPVEAGGYNWYRVTADDDALEGWIAEAPARSFNCAYYFVGFDGELPPVAPDPIPDRQACDLAEPLTVGGWAVIAGKTNINYRAEPGLGGSRSGTLAPGTVLELLDGPEEADGYEWWQVRNVVMGIEGWLAQGGVLSSGDCLRWLLPLETEDAMDDESDMDESADEMMDEEDDDTEPEESAQEDAADSSP